MITTMPACSYSAQPQLYHTQISMYFNDTPAQLKIARPLRFRTLFFPLVTSSINFTLMIAHVFSIDLYCILKQIKNLIHIFITSNNLYRCRTL